MARKPRIPAYSLHKASGRAVVKVSVGGGKQRSIYLGVFGSTESEVAYARVKADIRAGRPITVPTPPRDQDTAPLQTTITVAELAAKYKAHAETYYVKGGKVTSESL